MRAHVALIALLLLSGCAHWFGPAHGLVELVGSTPNGGPCELSLVPVGAPGPGPRAVAGQFREHFVVNHSRKGHVAQLSCGGLIVSARTIMYGRDVDFGGEVLLHGGVP